MEELNGAVDIATALHENREACREHVDRESVDDWGVAIKRLRELVVNLT